MRSDPAFVRSWRARTLAAAGVTVALAVSLAACRHDGRSMRPAGTNQTLSITTTPTTTSAAATTQAAVGTVAPTNPQTSGGQAFRLGLPWADGGAITDAFTCNGGDAMPSLTWSGVPEGTVQLAVVVTDNDAAGFVHWIVAGIDPAIGGIDSGALPTGIVQAKNGFGKVGWNGPCPPAGSTHHYQFTLYALSTAPAFSDGDDAPAAISALDKASAAVDVRTGVYSH